MTAEHFVGPANGQRLLDRPTGSNRAELQLFKLHAWHHGPCDSGAVQANAGHAECKGVVEGIAEDKGRTYGEAGAVLEGTGWGQHATEQSIQGGDPSVEQASAGSITDGMVRSAYLVYVKEPLIRTGVF